MDKTQLNQRTADFLDSLNLSQRALDVISDTDFYSLHDVFGGCRDAEEVEDLVRMDFSL